MLVLDIFQENDKLELRFHNLRLSLTSFSCAKLKIIPSKLFGDGGFCWALNSISFPEVTEIRECAFGFQDQLKFIDIPKVEVIGKDAFQLCYNIERLELLNIKRIEIAAMSNSFLQ